MSFGDLIGQQEIKKRLRAMFPDRTAQSFMLTGADGIGKHLFAEEIAKALLCSEPDSDGACGKCPSCRYFTAGTHPDIKRIKADKTKTIKIADLRNDVTATVRIASQISKRKVYIINADELNPEGQNLLLKSLEEPPQGVCFIMISSDTSGILPTIMSRVTELRLTEYSSEEMSSILRKHTDEELTKERIDFLVSFSSGIPGKALYLLKDPDFAEEREEMLRLIKDMPTLGYTDILYDRYSYFDENRDRIGELLQILLWILGDISIMLATPDPSVIKNSDRKDELMKFVSDNNHLIVKNLSEAAAAVNTFARRLKSNVNFEVGCCDMLLAVHKELKR